MSELLCYDFEFTSSNPIPRRFPQMTGARAPLAVHRRRREGGDGGRRRGRGIKEEEDDEEYEVRNLSLHFLFN